MMLNETWQEQYDRMQRSFALLTQIGERNAHPQDVIPARDVLYHFCSDAFHLRDWIAATLGTDENSTKALVRQLNGEVILPSPELSACSDIANGFKHLVLHRRSYVTGTNQGHAEVVRHNIGLGVPPMRMVASMEASASVTHPDCTVDAEPGEPEPKPRTVAPRPRKVFRCPFRRPGRTQHVMEPEPEPPAPQAPASDEGWIQDTFQIDINGQQYDARDVATKAVAAWDQWLQGNSSIAAQLR